MQGNSQNPFDPVLHPTLSRWHSSVALQRDQNALEVARIEGNPVLYPQNSKIYMLMKKITGLQSELGEIQDDEIQQYKTLHPNLNITKVLKLESHIPVDGLLFGSVLSILNKLASDYRSFERSGVFTPVFSEKFLTFRGKKLLASSLFIIGACGFIDYIHINNFSGQEIGQLRFLEWCRAYRIAKCQLEFSGRDMADYQLANYNKLRYETLNSIDPVDNYVRLLQLSHQEILRGDSSPKN